MGRGGTLRGVNPLLLRSPASCAEKTDIPLPGNPFAPGSPTMNRSPSRRRLWIAVALVLPATILFASSALRAQSGLPKMPKMEPPKFPRIEPPKFPQIDPKFPRIEPTPFPKMERVWVCTKCGKDVGNGITAPSSCPFCGVKFINGTKLGDANKFGPNNDPGQGVAPIQRNNPPPIGVPPPNVDPPINPGDVNPPDVNPIVFPNNDPPPNNGQDPDPVPINAPAPNQPWGNAAPENASNDRGGMSTGAVVAIVVGSVFGCLVIVGGIGGIVWASLRNEKPARKKRRLPQSLPQKDMIHVARTDH
jgi:hypothetical protein